MTILQKICDNIETLKGLDLQGLTQWAKNNGMDSRAGFSNFKKALLKNGIDYNAMRKMRDEEKRNNLSNAVTHKITLYSDAKAKNDRFGITDEDGYPMWYGKFYSSDRDYYGEQYSGKVAAAKKAVWLASKIAEAVQGKVKLTLRVDAQWVVWSCELGRAAERLGVDLNVHWIPSNKNLAKKFTVFAGFKKWSDNDLSALAEKI